jgi:hypothetical protein
MNAADLSAGYTCTPLDPLAVIGFLEGLDCSQESTRRNQPVFATTGQRYLCVCIWP